MQSKSDIYNCVVQQNTTRMQISHILFLNKFQADLSSIFEYLFINVYFVKCDDLVIWVENPKKWVYLFTGHPVDSGGKDKCQLELKIIKYDCLKKSKIV